MPDLKSFHEDVKRGDLDAVRDALAEQPSLLDQTNEAGQSAFLLAKYYRQHQISDFLLTLNPKLDVFTSCVAGLNERVIAEVERDSSLLQTHSSDGWTPLHLAAFFGHAGLAAALLDRGADVNALSTNHMRNTPLHAAVAGRRQQSVEVLLQHNADVNALQHGGWTALHGAAQNGDREIVAALIAQGAHVLARAENNQSPLDMALVNGHRDVAALLQQLGEGPRE